MNYYLFQRHDPLSKFLNLMLQTLLRSSEVKESDDRYRQIGDEGNDGLIRQGSHRRALGFGFEAKQQGFEKCPVPQLLEIEGQFHENQGIETNDSGNPQGSA